MKVFLYERVSSEEQVKHGYSLDAQHEALTDFCKKHDHIILGTYKDEGISARKPYTKRPAMVELLRDVETIKPDMILFTKLDRWFRNIKEYYRVQDILDRTKVDWKAINEEYDTSTASGRLYVNIKLSIAQDEADRTGERIKDVQRQLVAQGKWLGGNIPFGYALTNDNHLVFDENVGILKEAINYFVSHHTLNATAVHINDKYGTGFTHAKLKRLFSQSILKGVYRDNYAYCPPLLTTDEWDRLQDLLPRNIKKSSSRVYLFSGMIHCPSCGRRMAGVTAHDTQYYRCRYHTDGRCDQTGNVREDKIEQWLLDNIEDDYKVQVTMRPKVKKTDPKKYKDRLKRLNDMYLMGNISLKEYKEKSADLQQKIAESSKKPSLKTQIFATNWKDLYLELDPVHRRSFWQNLVKEVAVDQYLQPFQIVY